MRFLKIPCCLALVGLLASCADQTTDPIDAPLLAMGGNSGPSANGGWMWLGYFGNQNQAFQVRRNTDGTVSGSLQLKFRDPYGQGHASLDCLEFISDNEAIVGGVWTQLRGDYWDIFGAEVGSRVWMRVKDNGEGVPDEHSDVWGDGPSFGVFVNGCAEEPFLPNDIFPPGFIPDYLTVEKGNIQVRP